MSVLDQLSEKARVAVIRLRSLGDCVLTTPALALLKRARPDIEIGVVAEERFAAIFAGNPAVAQLIQPTWQAVRRWKPELCVNLHGGAYSQLMTALSGARWRAGFGHHSTTFAYNLRIQRARRILGVNRRVHTAEHLASAFFALGVPLSTVPRAELFASKTPLAERHAVLHPFASAPEKQWPADRFTEVARYLELWNIKPIFLAGPKDDATPFVAHQICRGSLEHVKGMLSNASLFIGTDRGPAHMAAAFGIPSIVLFSTSDPAVQGPWQTDSEVIVARDGLAKVSVSRVIAALERLLALTEAHA